MGDASSKFTNLWQLLSNISTDKHSLKVNPQILHSEPVFDDVSCIRKFLNPALDVLLKRSVISGENTQSHFFSAYETFVRCELHA